MKCVICKKENASETLKVCVECIRNSKGMSYVKESHREIRERFNLPAKPPKDDFGIKCDLCANECSMGEGKKGYCGLRENKNGKLVSKVTKNYGLAHLYLDPLPTNCCAAWFCEGSKERGSNLAVFFYGCNFNCAFCQNPSHKNIDTAPGITRDGFVDKALDERVKCICFFGGSPEPQLSFAINVSEMVMEKSRNTKRICWEWNGCANKKLVKKAAELSFISKGTVKFDLKAYNENLSYALSGVSNKRAYENFEMIGRDFDKDKNKDKILTATTLLVPFYVNSKEVEAIARFISEINPKIPYSLLIFHPDFYMRDLPVTPRKQVFECYDTAKKYLRNVNIGNKHLLLM